jgi:hypothetical protein
MDTVINSSHILEPGDREQTLNSVGLRCIVPGDDGGAWLVDMADLAAGLRVGKECGTKIKTLLVETRSVVMEQLQFN